MYGCEAELSRWESAWNPWPVYEFYISHLNAFLTLCTDNQWVFSVTLATASFLEKRQRYYAELGNDYVKNPNQV